VELAEEIFQGWRMRILLFTAYFNPATVPGLTDVERLEMVKRVQRSVFREA
jgi:hypothetical protein